MNEATDRAHAAKAWKKSVEFDRAGVTYILKYDPPDRYRFPSDFGDSACFQQRGLNAAIFRGDDYLGFLQFECYKFDRLLFTPKHFAYEMDAIGGDEYELGMAFSSCWTAPAAKTIASLGFVLEFHRAWIRPEHRPCLAWVDAAEHLINTVFRQHSIMLMNAAPMELQNRNNEFRGRLDDLTEAEAARKKQQHAIAERHRQHMVRAYQRLFRVSSLPGDWGQQGWLWRPRRGLQQQIKPPRLSRRIDPYD